METIVRIQLSPVGRWAYRGAVLIFAALALVLLMHGNAYAADEGDVGVTPTAWTLSIDAGAWHVLNLAVIPVVHGLLLKAQASNTLKVAATFAITALSTLFAYVVVDPSGVALLSSSSLLMWALSFVESVTGHYGIYKPLGVTSSNRTALAPTHGIG